MSGKAQMYQGVRVRTTVKELLQMRRAKQAHSGGAKEKTVFAELKELCQATPPTRRVHPPPPPPITSPSVDPYPVPMLPACTFNAVQQPYEEDVQLPANDYYRAELPPLTWSHGISSDTDYYGLESFCPPLDNLSYSPHDSSSSSSCYGSSPYRMDSAYLCSSDLYVTSDLLHQDSAESCWMPPEFLPLSSYYPSPVEDFPPPAEMSYKIL